MRTGEAGGLRVEKKVMKIEVDDKSTTVEEYVATFPADLTEEIFGYLKKLSVFCALGDDGSVELIDGELESPYTCYTMIKIGVSELEDSDVNIGSILIDSDARAFAYALDKGLTEGDGSLTPKGEPGTPLGILHCGCPESDIGLTVKDLSSVLDMERTLGNIAFMMNSHTEMRVREVHGADWGTYVWAASEKSGEPNTLLGRPLYNNEDLPDGVIIAGRLRGAFRVRLSKRGWTMARLPEIYKDKREKMVAFRSRILIELSVKSPESLRILRCSM